MAFSTAQIKRTKKSQSTDIRKYFGVVNGMTIMTPNIKYALERYINYTLKCRRISTLTADNIVRMIYELFENCCNKPYLDICKSDLLQNEKEILYQIKKAIYYGSTSHLYNIYETGVKEVRLANFRKDILPPKRISCENNLTSKQVADYFEELVI